MKVQILHSDKHTGVKKGEVYRAERYWLDPFEKVTLFYKNGRAKCNEYIHNIKILPQ